MAVPHESVFEHIEAMDFVDGVPVEIPHVCIELAALFEVDMIGVFQFHIHISITFDFRQLEDLITLAAALDPGVEFSVHSTAFAAPHPSVKLFDHVFSFGMQSLRARTLNFGQSRPSTR